ncbi:MAG: class I SAM-dependent methyltransferase [Candidatus Jordarchaeaceae archaeon]
MKEKIIKLGYKMLNSKYFSKFFSSYRLIWEIAGATKSTAMDAVLFGVKNEEDFWARGKEDAQKLKKFVDKGSIVLDIGCGIGRVEKFLAQHCKEIHGVDVSSRMLKFAKENLKEHPNVFLHRTNGKDLSLFSDGKFDFVFSLLTLQHMEKEDVFYYLIEIRRVLKKGGKVYLQFPNFLPDKIFKWFAEYAKKGAKHIARVRGYTEPEVKKMLYHAGFDILEVLSYDDDIIVIASK